LFELLKSFECGKEMQWFDLCFEVVGTLLVLGDSPW
jgi:hypothetical protein